MELAMLFAAVVVSAGGADASRPGTDVRWNYAPRAGVLRVMGCAADHGTQRSVFPQGNPVGAGQLSAEGRDYLSRLAACAPRPDAGPPTGSAADTVRDCLIEQVRRVGPVAFVVQHPLARPRAAGCAIWQSVPERWGCSIRVYDPADARGAARTLFEDPDGAIFDMSLASDAATLYFAHRTRTEDCWQLWEIGVDGRGLKRISRDSAHHDVSPVELPDGDLLFVSTRAGGYLVSEPGPRSNLWRMRSDGSGARCVSQNTLADFSPRLMFDGRVLFTRWEYVDRDLDYRLGLWTQKPDGTQFQLFFGNTIREVGIFWQARAVPGHDDLVVATFAPPTGWPHGAIGLVTNRRGPEAPRDQGFAWLTDESLDVGDTTVHTDGMSYRDVEDGRLRDLAIHDGAFRPEGGPADLSLSYEMEARADGWLNADRPAYRDPFPVSDYLFLVAYAAPSTQRFELYLLDLCGNRIPFYSDPDMGTYHPLCLRPSSVYANSSVRDRAQDSDLDSQWGRVLLTDVECGLPEAARGRARYLQIMEQLPKTHQFARRAYDQSPVMGYGTYYAKRCWGRVPIESDGSAYFELPALREVYLQVLDAEGRELQRQTSSLQVMPGEVRSCIGCHEPRGMAPVASAQLPLAAQRPATRPAPPAGTDEGRMDFVAVVQPVLDRYCVQCHSGPDPDGGCDLSGDRTRLFNMAYDNLLGRSHSYRQHNLTTGEMLSQEAARGQPLVHFYWLRRAPTGKNPPLASGSYVSRISEYLGRDHGDQETAWEDRQRVYMWIDANVPYYSDYAASRPLTPGGRDLCADPATGLPARWFAERLLEVYNRRCLACHGAFPDPNDYDRLWNGQYAWINFTRPVWSPMLTAHLSRDAGGRGVPTRRLDAASLLFVDTHDPDYLRLLEAIQEGSRRTLDEPAVGQH